MPEGNPTSDRCKQLTQPPPVLTNAADQRSPFVCRFVVCTCMCRWHGLSR